MNKKTDNLRSLLFTPPQSSALFIEFAKTLQPPPPGTPDLRFTFGVPSMDKVIIPLYPGKVFFVLGRPGHGKSSLLAYLAKYNASKINYWQQQDKYCIIYLSYEEPIEIMEAFFQIGVGSYSMTDIMWGRVNIEDLIRNSVNRTNLPIWCVGRSVMRRRATVEKVPPRMTLDNVYQVCQTLEEDYGIRPMGVLLDYIQRVPSEKNKDIVQTVIEVTHAAGDLSKEIAAPFVIGAQASRAVDAKDPPIPEQDDFQWGSVIEQDMDGGLALWRPWKTHGGLGDTIRPITINGQTFNPTPNTLIAKHLKQRGDDSGHLFALNFRPEYIQLADMEMDFDERAEVMRRAERPDR